MNATAYPSTTSSTNSNRIPAFRHSPSPAFARVSTSSAEARRDELARAATVALEANSADDFETFYVTFRSGLWHVEESRGLAGGVFVSESEAVKFVHRQARSPRHVRLERSNA
jgi:hypothetical protein